MSKAELMMKKKYNRLTWHRKERRKGHPVLTKELIRQLDAKEFFEADEE